MIIDLTPLFAGETNSQSASLDYDVTQCSYDIISGTAATQIVCKNTSGYAELTASFDVRYEAACARCARGFAGNIRFNVTYPLTNYPMPDNDEYILAEGGRLDLDDFCATVLTLQLPMKFVCSPDCKGLCAKCGADRNTTDCGCPIKDIDPRLAVLKDFFNGEK